MVRGYMVRGQIAAWVCAVAIAGVARVAVAQPAGLLDDELQPLPGEEVGDVGADAGEDAADGAGEEEPEPATPVDEENEVPSLGQGDPVLVEPEVGDVGVEGEEGDETGDETAGDETAGEETAGEEAGEETAGVEFEEPVTATATSVGRDSDESAEEDEAREITYMMQIEGYVDPLDVPSELMVAQQVPFDVPAVPNVQAMFDIPVAQNSAVEHHLRIFGGKGRGFFGKWLERSQRYIPLFQKILAEYGVPADTVYLALIESGFKASAHSWANAAGIWQFIPQTGRHYGLTIDFWLDERRDIVKATRAAARFLSDLYGIFGDWHLAWAAYNAGQSRLLGAVRKSSYPEFWDLQAEAGLLALETRHYVPKLIAAALVAKDPVRFGLERLDYEYPVDPDAVVVRRAVDLEKLAALTGLDGAWLVEMNQHLRRGMTPPSREAVVYVPRGNGARVKQLVEEASDEALCEVRVHTVAKGESLGGIAARYKSRGEAIAAFNEGVRDDGRGMRVGMALRVPVLPKHEFDAGDKKERRRGGGGAYVPQNLAGYKGDAALKGKTHTVRKGENPWTIAQKYGMPVDALMAANGLTRDDVRRVRVGQKLQLYYAGGGGGGVAAGTGAGKAASGKAASGKAASGKAASGKAAGKNQHKVVSGDTLGGIAEKYGTTVTALCKLNGITKRSKLRLGQVLRVR